jgi:hypothetical protein
MTKEQPMAEILEVTYYCFITFVIIIIVGVIFIIIAINIIMSHYSGLIEKYL